MISIEDATRGGYASGQARRAAALDRANRTAAIERITDGLPTEQIGPKLLQMALTLAAQAANSQVPLDTAADVRALAQAGDIIYKMSRLEQGQSTSNQATFAVQGDREQRAKELEARLTALRAEDQATG